MPLHVEPRRDRKLNRLLKAADLQRLRRGEILIEPRHGDPLVYLVRSGHLRLARPASGRERERTVGVVGPWELLWEEGLRPGPRRYRCVAGEPTSYQALHGHAVWLVLKSTERTFEALLECVARDLDVARRLGAGAPGPGASQRLAIVLLDLAHRWGEPQGKGILIPQRLTHQVLADLAGAHRSTVTTILNDWLYQGVLVAAKRGIDVAQPERLVRLAGEAASPDTSR